MSLNEIKDNSQKLISSIKQLVANREDKVIKFLI